MVNSFLFSSVLIILSVSAKTLSHIWIDHILILNSSYCTVSDNSRDTQPKLALPCPWAALNRHSKMTHKPCHSQNSISNQFWHSSSSGSPDRSELAGYFHQGFLLSTALCWEAAGVEDNFSALVSPRLSPLLPHLCAWKCARHSSRKQSSSCAEVEAFHASIVLWVVTWVVGSCLSHHPAVALIILHYLVCMRALWAPRARVFCRTLLCFSCFFFFFCSFVWKNMQMNKALWKSKHLQKTAGGAGVTEETEKLGGDAWDKWVKGKEWRGEERGQRREGLRRRRNGKRSEKRALEDEEMVITWALSLSLYFK